MTAARKIDLGDPSFEPTDEELQELSRRAFEGVGARHAAALKQLELKTAEERRKALERLEESLRKQP